MLPRKYGFAESVIRLLFSALVLGILLRGVWEAAKFGWSLLGVAP